MIDPGTAMLVASAIQAAAKGGSDFMASKGAAKQAKRKAKEAKRETESGMVNDALQRSAEAEVNRLKSRKKLGQRKSQSFQDTADLVRGAFEI